ncbi:N-acetylneuraminate synthase family protein [Salinibacter ruber]|uniref:N-acetylneuraminate synthase family protein n=1 Tax=Salinibacter ruber TaxID=146919 RepID=UPI0021698201|nr:N-acetylneuraminate synthase family protein [Salinibacter ruber]MCS4039534.1 sialic acid synthase SpsE [Salinibacter ruber]
MPSLDQVFSESLFEMGRPYVVAEMACAHDGSVERALSITQAASKADALQVQLFHAEELVVPQEVPAARELELAPESWKRVTQKARADGLDLWATVFDEEAIDLALKLDAAVLKIHSTDISNPFLLQACAQTNLPLSLSAGGSTVSEVASAVRTLEDHGASNLILTHGFQDFPTAPEDARLGFISTLDRLFPYPAGYQDHTDGASDLAYTLPLAAIGLGARVIEKHITDDRSREGTDYISALGPEGFAEFVEKVNAVNGAFSGKCPDDFSEAEREYRQSMKRRIVAGTEIPTGTTITKERIDLLRADDGIKANRLDVVLGRESQRSLEPGEAITEDHLK